jgi:uncharacterized protein YjhX (UPF0386 family)
VRIGLAIAVLLALTGCGGEKKTAQPTVDASPRAERCTQRILDRVRGDNGAEARAYIDRAYCVPFDRKGWVYADGTLSIDAHLFLLNSGVCSAGTSDPGGSATTTVCDPADLLDPLECAVLHYVRKDEVKRYIRKLKRKQPVRCDDGTPLDKLGAE